MRTHMSIFKEVSDNVLHPPFSLASTTKIHNKTRNLKKSIYYVLAPYFFQNLAIVEINSIQVLFVVTACSPVGLPSFTRIVNSPNLHVLVNAALLDRRASVCLIVLRELLRKHSLILSIVPVNVPKLLLVLRNNCLL